MFLYDIFKKWQCTDGINRNTVWLYADPHFGDPDSAAMRPGGPTDEEQIKAINAKVGKKDTLVILGDVGDLSYAKKLRGYKVLITGNHDGGASNYRRIVETVLAFNSERLSQDDADEICRLYEHREVALMRGDKKEVDENDARIKEITAKAMWTEVRDNRLFDEVYEGPVMVNDKLILSHEPVAPLPPCLFNIHGHTHGAPRRPDAGHMCVCAEAIGYEPVNLIGELKTGLLKDVPSIHRETIDRATAKKQKKGAHKEETK